MRKLKITFAAVSALLAAGLLLGQSQVVSGLIPLWQNYRWTYLTLGPAFTTAGGYPTFTPPPPVSPYCGELTRCPVEYNWLGSTFC